MVCEGFKESGRGSAETVQTANAGFVQPERFRLKRWGISSDGYVTLVSK